MPLYSVLPTQSSVRDLATRVSSLLGTSSCLKRIERVTTNVKSLELYHYQWEDDFKNDFKNLADEIATTMVCIRSADIQLLLNNNSHSMSSVRYKK